MSDTHANPPRWASAFLAALLRPSDSESIPGDLLEEYREVRRPSLGRLRADAWYVKHVLSVLWRIAWPCVLVISVLRILSLPLPRGWNPSVVQAPGVSLLDALVFVWAGFYGSQRTGRLITGVLVSSVTGLLGFPIFFLYVTITTPGILLAPFEKPFMFVIMATLLAIALTFAAVFGTAGAVMGRRLLPSRWRAHPW